MSIFLAPVKTAPLIHLASTTRPQIVFGLETNLSSLDIQVEKALLNDGINKNYLERTWGVTLWRISSVPNKRVFIYLDPGSKKDPPDDKVDEILQRLQKPLTPFGNVVLKFKQVKKCCGKGCPGCIAYKGSGKTKDWLA